jgi:hypothetical protein
MLSTAVESKAPSALDDVLVMDAPLPLRATLFPLGFPVQLATNSQAVMAAARQSWGMFRVKYPETPLSLCMTVTEGEDEQLPPRPKFRAHLHLMSIVADGRNHVMCDFS